MAELGQAVLSLVTSLINGLPQAPAAHFPNTPTQSEPAPENPTPLPALLDTIAQAAQQGVNTAAPGYLAYIPGGGLYAAALADFLATALNRYVTVWNLAPALAHMENSAIRWLCDLFDYPGTARGILTSGGSLANFSAIVTARRTLLPPDFLNGTIYVTAQTHVSSAKAAMLAGFPQSSIRVVPTTNDLRMNPAALSHMITTDRSAGLTPFLVVASAGTTNTGAVDPLTDLAHIAQAEGLWFHVDAAYGGPFYLTQRGKNLFTGISTADSITLDPHKALFLPYGTGALLVREGHLLRDAHHLGADYLQDLDAEDAIPNFSEYSPELTRDFRGLRLWLPLKLHGLQPFRDALNEKLDLAAYAHHELEAAGFDLPWKPELSIVTFRWIPANASPTTTDAYNADLLDRVNASGRVFLSSTRVNGHYMLRLAIVSHRTHRDRIDEALTILKRATH
ncbi:aminotransferase class V-fold PLP-dependent enzyme [Nonomuraea sp. NBC_01738]|uniref:pyridoxal phosphate-dependent decarboxylase family protein n=1 Tax=Nonomuraea sp. NBC_01738 TaxID=2976003 RepID=UPI002E11BBA7|nr:aminotransferase class V-fold PLP-dependent enzyme [Nonomuraea sp. NBC_01738]